MSQPDIPFLEIAPPYAVLRIGNPDRANALNEPLIAALNEAMERLDADPSIRAIIFTGAGADVFCSGFDLKALVAGAPLTVTDNPFVHFAGRVLTSPKLTIAAINGAVAGAAVHLVCSCDIRIAVDDATFAVPAGRLSLCYDPPSINRIVAEMGAAMARRIMLSDEKISARDLKASGFLADLVARDKLLPAAQDIAQRQLALGPLAIAAMKRIITANASSDGGAFRALQLDVAASDDHAEALRALAERRAPRFNNR